MKQPHWIPFYTYGMKQCCLMATLNGIVEFDPTHRFFIARIVFKMDLYFD